MRRYPPRRECDGSTRVSHQIAPSTSLSLCVSLPDPISANQQRLLDPDYCRSSVAQCLRLPVIVRPDWVTLSRDRTTIQLSDRKLYDILRSSRCVLLYGAPSSELRPKFSRVHRKYQPFRACSTPRMLRQRVTFGWKKFSSGCGIGRCRYFRGKSAARIIIGQPMWRNEGNGRSVLSGKLSAL